MNHKATLSTLILSTLFLLNANISFSETINNNSLGRLFTTPTERQKLDYKRLHGGNTSKPNKSNIQLNHNTSSHISITGIVKRDNGETTIWIKQGAQTKETRSHAPTHRNFSSVKIQLPGADAPVTIKPGQTWVRSESKVYDNWLLPKPKIMIQKDTKAK